MEEAVNGLVRFNPENTESFPSELKFEEIPITALRQKARMLLSKLLNPVKVLPSEEGFARDWRGVAHLCGLQNLYGHLIAAHQDPMSKVLQLWCKEEESANFHHLQKYLGIIDRWDVADDIKEALVQDGIQYLTAKHQEALAGSTSHSVLSPPTIKPDANVLTIDDVSRSQQGLKPQHYDAFVLFADEDIDFATELIERMENCGFKLCVKERDLIGGISFEHEAILRLISERCNRLIVIVSPAFLQSPANTFFVNFAQALGIEQGRRKIVPCLYEKCILPPTLSFYFLLNYQRSGKLWNFWDKLKESIQNTPYELSDRQNIRTPRITITEVISPEVSITPQLQIESGQPDSDKYKTPDKVARKRREKMSSISSQDSYSPLVPSYSSLSSTKLSSGYSKTLELEQIEPHIMPPRPKLRNTSSMLELRAVEINSPDSDSVITSGSTLVLSACKSSQSGRKISFTKKVRKFLSPNTTHNGATLSDDPKEKTKRKWFRKKIASYT